MKSTSQAFKSAAVRSLKDQRLQSSLKAAQNLPKIIQSSALDEKYLSERRRSLP